MTPKIPAKDAVNAAIEFYKDAASSEEIGSFEEIEYDDEEGYWIITLGFIAPQQPTLTPFVIPPKKHKDLRIFRVNGETGEVVSMKLRE